MASLNRAVLTSCFNSVADGLFFDFKAGDIDREEYHRLKGKLKEQAALAEEVIARLKEEQRQLEEGVIETNIFDVFLKHKNVTGLDRFLLTELIETIFVHEDKKITVVFRFEDQYKRVVEYVERRAKEIENS